MSLIMKSANCSIGRHDRCHNEATAVCGCSCHVQTYREPSLTYEADPHGAQPFSEKDAEIERLKIELANRSVLDLAASERARIGGYEGERLRDEIEAALSLGVTQAAHDRLQAALSSPTPEEKASE